MRFASLRLSLSPLSHCPCMSLSLSLSISCHPSLHHCHCYVIVVPLPLASSFPLIIVSLPPHLLPLTCPPCEKLLAVVGLGAGPSDGVILLPPCCSSFLFLMLLLVVLAILHPQSTPQAVACEAGGRWCVIPGCVSLSLLLCQGVMEK